MASTTTEAPTGKLTESMKGLVIGASGMIPGYRHDRIKKIVEECGAKFTTTDLGQCTHLVTTPYNFKRRLKKITEAGKQEDCKIVSIDWLLQSKEKHAPVSVEEYSITSRKKKLEDKLEKKRAREVSPAGVDSGPSKKQKEQHPPSQYLIYLVDEGYPEPSDTLSVWQDAEGVVWDATLVNDHKDGRNGVVMCIQLLMCQEPQRFHTWAFEYKVGHILSSNESIGASGSLNSAKKVFETMFKKFSGLAWEDRHALPLEDKWIFVETHQRHHGDQIPTTQVTTLKPGVDRVLGLILTSSIIENQYNNLIRKICGTLQRSGTPQLDVQGKSYLIGVAILGRLTALAGGTKADNVSLCKERLLRACNTLIPMPKYYRITIESAESRLKSLDLLSKLHNAGRILRSDPSSPLALSHISQMIGLAEIDPAGHRRVPPRTSREAKSFAEWAKEHSSKIGDRRLLWHGSPTHNFSSILTVGLRGLHPNIPVTRGIYFAEMSTKSAIYCRKIDKKSGEALLLLCEVELGKSSSLSTEYRGSSYYTTWRDAGDIHPNLKGTRVPDFNTKVSAASSLYGLYHSEFVVHNPAQIRQRYLFHVELKEKV
ncbi:uncharacterized protein N7515_005003 [Penicillium bovifimosum]|uniref:Poly [ADP-ribose] polymerase n=1 Tax=Penicillium bovifimosum TaxID=126998 RepID=A0A9W9H1H6_9EURO|nr:uncharacterized protein N7515_005003 [Penicillium bovifimosum]KAJ5135725.1 hypothetical protein N7515_005003 [Penicillium bovifimosum]